jgi:hypothetical protein
MKLKLLILALFLALSGSLFAQQPTTTVFGSGPPGGTVAYIPGTHYIDQSVSPAVLYVCSSVSVATGPNPPAGTQTCNWTQAGGGGGAAIADPAFVGAAITNVGGAPQVFQIGYGQNAGSASLIAATFPYATSQNHTYLVNVFQPSTNTVTSVVTTQSDTCTQVGSTQTVASKNIQIFKCLNVTGGASTTITANFSAAGTFNTMSIVELAPSDVDVSAAATGTSTAPSSGNFTTTNAQDLLIGYIDFFTTSSCSAQDTAFNQCNTPGSGYATVMGQDGQFGNVNIFLESKSVTGTGAFAANGTLKVSASWAAFGIAMAGTPVTPVISNSSGAGPFSLGTITSLLTPVQFKISGGQITAGSGQLSINVTGGSITNPAWALESSIDGGTSWFSVPCTVRTQSNVIAGEQVPIYSAQCSLTGLMGETGTNFRFGPYQGYGISNLVVWGAI